MASESVQIPTAKDLYEVELAPASYDIEVTANGFQRIHKEKIEVRPVPNSEINFHMARGHVVRPNAVEPDLPDPVSPRITLELSGSVGN